MKARAKTIVFFQKKYGGSNSKDRVKDIPTILEGKKDLIEVLTFYHNENAETYLERSLYTLDIRDIRNLNTKINAYFRDLYDKDIDLFRKKIQSVWEMKSLDIIVTLRSIINNNPNLSEEKYFLSRKAYGFLFKKCSTLAEKKSEWEFLKSVIENTPFLSQKIPVSIACFNSSQLKRASTNYRRVGGPVITSAKKF